MKPFFTVALFFDKKSLLNLCFGVEQEWFALSCKLVLATRWKDFQVVGAHGVPKFETLLPSLVKWALINMALRLLHVVAVIISNQHLVGWADFWITFLGRCCSAWEAAVKDWILTLSKALHQWLRWSSLFCGQWLLEHWLQAKHVGLACGDLLKRQMLLRHKDVWRPLWNRRIHLWILLDALLLGGLDDGAVVRLWFETELLSDVIEPLIVIVIAATELAHNVRLGHAVHREEIVLLVELGHTWLLLSLGVHVGRGLFDSLVTISFKLTFLGLFADHAVFLLLGKGRQVGVLIVANLSAFVQFLFLHVGMLHRMLLEDGLSVELVLNKIGRFLAFRRSNLHKLRLKGLHSRILLILLRSIASWNRILRSNLVVKGAPVSRKLLGYYQILVVEVIHLVLLTVVAHLLMHWTSWVRILKCAVRVTLAAHDGIWLHRLELVQARGEVMWVFVFGVSLIHQLSGGLVHNLNEVVWVSSGESFLDLSCRCLLDSLLNASQLFYWLKFSLVSRRLFLQLEVLFRLSLLKFIVIALA